MDTNNICSKSEDDEAYDYDEAFTAGNDATLARLRRENGSAIENGTPKKGAGKGKLTPDASQVADSPKKQRVLTNGASSQPTRRWWHTYKYRDLLGIVVLCALINHSPHPEDTIAFGRFRYN